MRVKKKGKQYMKKKKSKIPEFKNYEEEARFWDMHSFTEFEDELEDVEIIFDLDKPRDETLVVRLQKDIKVQMEKVARNKGLNVSTLARMWFIEKLRASR